MSSIILGSKVLIRGDDSSKPGLVFTSKRNILRYLSTIKSNPKSSKQYFLLFILMVSFTAWKVILIKFLILLKI
jgi:hypothetical protein